MELTKEKIDELLAVEKEYKKVIDDQEKLKTDAIEKAKIEKIKEDIINGMHGKKIVFSPAPATPENNVDYKSFGEFLKMVASDDIRLKTAMSTSNAQGGYTIPVEYSKEILGALNNVAQAPAKCTPIDMNAPVVDFPAWLTDLSVAWSTEATNKSVTKPTFTQRQLTLKFLYAIITMTNELAEDNTVDLSRQLMTLVGENMGLELEQEIFEGTSFTGITSAANNVVCNAPITYNDLISCINNTGQLERYKTAAEWWLTRGALSLILNMVDQNGRPLWNMGNPSIAGIPPTILGKPYSISDQIADTTGAGGTTTIYFGDMKTVYLGKKAGDAGGIRVLFSETAVIDTAGTIDENAFQSNKQMYRFEMRRGILVAVPASWVKISNVA